MDTFDPNHFTEDAIRLLQHRGITPGDAEYYGLMHNDSKCGWVTPTGEFFTNRYGCHYRTAMMFGFNCSSQCEKLGWVHVSQMDNSRRYANIFRLTPKQRSKLEDLGFEIDNASERMLPWRQPDADSPDPILTPRQAAIIEAATNP